MIEKIYSENASKPAGYYSQALVYGDFIFVSGQLPVDSKGEKCLGSAEEQTRAALKNVQEILLAAGSDLDHVLKTTVYVSDIQLWGRVNEAYAAVFGEHRPARSVVPTKDLHYGFLVEIEAVAVKISKS